MQGEIIGDYELIEELPDEMVRVRCKRCKNEKVYTLKWFKKGRTCPCIRLGAGICRECGKGFYSIHKKEFCSPECVRRFIQKKAEHKRSLGMGLKRKVTKTTKKLICIYTEEGESIGEIADCLKRPESVIKKILKECKESGEYQSIINNCPILQARKR